MSKEKKITIQLDAEFLKTIYHPILMVWQEVAADAMSSAGTHGDPMNNEDAIETCLDADRLTTNGYEKEDDLIGKAIDEHGYPAVMKFLKKNIKLL